MRAPVCQTCSMTGRSKAPDSKRAAMGVSTHSGWAAFVVLAGDPLEPEIIARGRMTLCDPAIIGSKQPFHHAEPMPFAEAEKFIATCAASTKRLATGSIAAIRDKADVKSCCVLTASGKPLPGLKAILASHSYIHAAEGEFYRDAIAAAAEAAGLTVRRVRSRDLETEMEALAVSGAAVKTRLSAFGKALGAPWTQDEKMSAQGAWLMLPALLPRRAGTDSRR
jgi:hypothetical protein